MTAIFLSPSGAEWRDPTSGQFHIQTDEGPERYFKYQTQSGQYRREKRLEDGTVVGSYGWIDSNGFLRMRDYIADRAGYRILKTKKVYVGRDSPIAQAIKIAKKAPAEAGTLLETPAPVAAYGLATPSRSFHRTQAGPDVYATEAPLRGNLPCADCSLGGGYTPNVQISPNSFPSSTESPLSTTLSPPQPSLNAISSTPAPVGFLPTASPPTVVISSKAPSRGYVVSSTGKPFVTTTAGYGSSPYGPSTTPLREFSTPSSAAPFGSSTPRYVSTTSTKYTSTLDSSAQNLFIPKPILSTVAPPINSNSIDFNGYAGDPQYEHHESTFHPYLYRNEPTYPLERDGNVYAGANSIGNGYDPQYPKYDGVSTTSDDGFRYYIPRAYHEEKISPDASKTGSFGYVDPFGIRRVIYYNASPGRGFLHRKNNRYVGFDATPYDPRPY